MGKPCFFIRTYGCPLHCPWCDSAGTWHKDYVPDGILKYTAEQLADMALESGAPFVVVTGGEPTVHDLTFLTQELRVRGLRCHLETSGSFPITGEWHWITLSPKKAKRPLLNSVASCDELKFIVDSPDAITYWDSWYKKQNELREEPDLRYPTRPIWLHPEWSQRGSSAILCTISEFLKNNQQGQYRAGYQLHKMYNVDALDNRSKPLVPLGGNKKLGY